MGERNVLYLSHIADGIFRIYKFSNYGTCKIELIAAGIAYDKQGNYSKKYTKLIQKYNLDEFMDTIHSTSSSYMEFLESIYYNNEIMVNKLPVPHLAYKLLTEITHPYREKRMKEIKSQVTQSMLDEQNERIKKQKSLLSEEDRKSLFGQ